MTAIWQNPGGGWRLLSPVGFSQEAALHDLVEQAPQLLPLAGAPRLTIVDREVRLGTGSADLIAIEPDGRLAVIEVKLAKNAEARRAIVSQVLSYAAYLHGQEPGALERETLGQYLSQHGYQALAEAVASGDQEHSFEPGTFAQGVASSLAEGRFRIVLVLDEAPDELVQLVGYLEAVTDKLLIDLVTVSAYDVGGSQILVPQRVEPERRSPGVMPVARPAPQGREVEGGEDFAAVISQTLGEERAILQNLYRWACSLEDADLVKLTTYHGKEFHSLLPRLVADKAGLVTIYVYRGKASLQLWRSVFERHAPQTLAALSERIKVGQGNNVPRDMLDDKLLEELTVAYREAVGSPAQA